MYVFLEILAPGKMRDIEPLETLQMLIYNNNNVCTLIFREKIVFTISEVSDFNKDYISIHPNCDHIIFRSSALIH